MRILASGDHHWDEHSRLDECRRIHEWMVAEAHRQQADLFLSAGDIYERASTPKEREAVAAWLTSMAEVCPVIIVKGNHDRPHDVHLLRRIRSRHPIHVVENFGVHYVNNTAIATLAWPSRSVILASLGQRASSDAANDLARGALQDVLRGLGAEMAVHDGPKILLTHAMVDGSETSLGQPLVGAEMGLPLSDLALSGADIVVAGHIHMPQAWSIGAAGKTIPVVYTGSPYRTAFGEVEPKSILRIVTSDENDELVWSRIQTPAKPMLLVEAAWSSAESLLEITSETAPKAGDLCDAEIRLRYKVGSDWRDAARRAALDIRDRYVTDGAASVKIEEQVIATTRARTPEIATATTLADKLRCLWAGRRTTPNEPRSARIFSKLDEIEHEVAS